VKSPARSRLPGYRRDIEIAVDVDGDAIAKVIGEARVIAAAAVEGVPGVGGVNSQGVAGIVSSQAKPISDRVSR